MNPKPITLTQVDEGDYSGPAPQPLVIVGDAPGGGGAVDSVNGQVGEVVLDAEDIEVVGGVTVFTAITEAIPSAVNGAGRTAEWDQVSGKPSTFAPSAHTHVVADIADLDPSDFATAEQGALADSAVQPSDPRLPIVLTQAAYDALTPVEGQVYIIQG